MPKIIRIAPVVVPGMGQGKQETVVWGLDDEGGLWKWDTGMTSDQWVQVVKPPKKK